MKGLELIDSAGPLLAAGIDGITHLDLSIDATVEAVMSDRLRNEQQRHPLRSVLASATVKGLSLIHI